MLRIGICLLFFAKLGLAAYGGHDLFTSLGQLNELWKNDKSVVQDMKDVIAHMDDIKDTFEKYIKSHEDAQLDQEPNFEYLGNPLNGYFLIRHVAFGWGAVRTKVFEAENATRQAFGKGFSNFIEFNLKIKMHSFLFCENDPHFF